MATTTKRRPFAADYTFTVEGNVIAIVDLNLGNRSVTNDIEYILDDIRSEMGDLAGFSVIYRDSMGRWDGVRLVNRTIYFYGFGEADKECAMNRLLHLVEQ